MALTLVTHAEPSDRDLRRELQDAITSRNAADASTAAANRTLNKASELLCEAAQRVTRLKAAMDDMNAERVAARAQDVLAALKAGSPAPSAAAPWPAAADSAELTAALREFHALELAAGTLGGEFNAAVAVSARAANTVHILVTAIMEAEARALCADTLAAFDHYWRLRDQLSGYFRMDETKLTELQREIAITSMAKTSDGLGPRQARAAAKNPLYLESSNWMDFLDRIATGSEKKWRDYGQRLANDATARFEESTS